jgi:hypothetical protein
MVIAHGAQIYVVAAHKDWEGGREAHEALTDDRLRSLWVPLPETHPRVQLWIRHVYQHMAHCYRDQETLEHGRPAIVVFPVPDYKLRKFVDDHRFSSEWRALEQKKIALENKEIVERATKIAIPQNHDAVRLVRKFYPAHEARLDLIEHQPRRLISRRYQREPHHQTPSECWRRGGFVHHHWDVWAALPCAG